MIIQSKEDLLVAIDSLSKSKVFALDTETTGLDPHTDKVRLVSIAGDADPTTVFIFDHFALEKDILLLQSLFSNQNVVIGHNLKFDIKMLWSLYKTYNDCIDISDCLLFDTYIVYKVCVDVMRHTPSSLKHLVHKYLDVSLSKEEQTSDWSAPVLSARQLEYAAADVLYLFPLRERLKSIALELKSWAARIECDYIPVLAALEYNGIYVNPSKVMALEEDIKKQVLEKEQEIYRHLPDCYFQPFLTGGGEYSVNLKSKTSQVLPRLRKLGVCIDNMQLDTLSQHYNDHPICKHLYEYSKLNKILSTYCSSLLQYIHPTTGRVHPDYFQIGTITGRLASSGFPMLQIPRDFCYRDYFDNSYDPDVVIINCDYAGIEARIAATPLFADSAEMQYVFEHDLDIYVYTAAAVSHHTYESLLALKETDPSKYKSLRMLGKVLVLSLNYGMGIEKYHYTKTVKWGIPSTMTESEKDHRAYHRLYPELRKWHKKCTEKWEDKQYFVSINGRYYNQAPTYTQAINLNVQSMCTDFFKHAQRSIFDKLKARFSTVPLFDRCPCRQTLYIHDEYNGECNSEYVEWFSSLIEKEMVASASSFLRGGVPVIAEPSTGNSWGAAH
jgi:DNA polymerase-1